MQALAVGLMVGLAQAWIPNHLAGECSKPNIDSGGEIRFFSRASGKYIMIHILKKIQNQSVQCVVYFNSIFDTFFFCKGWGEEKKG